jgi:hypothetical protein
VFKWLTLGGSVSLLFVVLTGAISHYVSYPGTGGSASSAPAHADALSPPAQFIPMYVAAAAACPGLPWPLLAAIHYEETRYHGDIDPTDAGEISSAGAVGPMQFMPGDWLEYGNGGNIFLVSDAIAAAGRKLCANGATHPAAFKPDPSGACFSGIPTDGIPGAIYAYNHECTPGGYVDRVTANFTGLMSKIASQPVAQAPTQTVAVP